MTQSSAEVCCLSWHPSRFLISVSISQSSNHSQFQVPISCFSLRVSVSISHCSWNQFSVSYSQSQFSTSHFSVLNLSSQFSVLNLNFSVSFLNLNISVLTSHFSDLIFQSLNFQSQFSVSHFSNLNFSKVSNPLSVGCQVWRKGTLAFVFPVTCPGRIRVH